jgi:hypothetical protein
MVFSSFHFDLFSGWSTSAKVLAIYRQESRQTDWCAVRAGLIDLIDRWQVALKLPLLAPGSLVLTGGRLFYAPSGVVVRWFKLECEKWTIGDL